MIGYVLDTPDEKFSDFITEAEAWAIGRWLADGSVDLKKVIREFLLAVVRKN